MFDGENILEILPPVCEDLPEMILRTACLMGRGTDPCRNLAIEKHLMDTLPDSTAILFMYQNRRAVVVGRNQNPWDECQVESFLEAGGVVTRRLSGGGASYQDEGTLNFSIILPKKDFDASRQLQLLRDVAGCFGVVTDSGMGVSLRSGGRAYCQNAFFKSGSVALHHGSIHVSTETGAMVSCLQNADKAMAAPDILNLRENCPEITVEDVQKCLYQGFAAYYRSEPAWLDEQMMDQTSIHTYAGHFGEQDWIYPAKMEYDFSVRERFPWGSVSVLLKRDGGIIRSARIYSDAMEAALFFPIEQGLVGCPFLIGAIGTRFTQKLEMVTDPRLLQIAGDVCTLICGRIRAQDRAGNHEE